MVYAHCRAGCVWKRGVAGYSCVIPVFSVESALTFTDVGNSLPRKQAGLDLNLGISLSKQKKAFLKSQRKQWHWLKNHHNTNAEKILSAFAQQILELLLKKSLLPLLFLSHPPLLPLSEDYLQDMLVEAVLIVLAVSGSWKTKKSLLTRKMR